MTMILGPLPCIDCGRTVYWHRVGSVLRLMERVRRSGRRAFLPHECEELDCRKWARAAA